MKMKKCCHKFNTNNSAVLQFLKAAGKKVAKEL